jgi:hypothetical protein
MSIHGTPEAPEAMQEGRRAKTKVIAVAQQNSHNVIASLKAYVAAISLGARRPVVVVSNAFDRPRQAAFENPMHAIVTVPWHLVSLPLCIHHHRSGLPMPMIAQL